MSKRKYMIAEPGERTTAPGGAAAKRVHARGAGQSPVWNKDNRGFWFVVCVGISLVFALVYAAVH